MSRRRKTQRVEGCVVSVPLGEIKQVLFGLVLKEPLMAFFDVLSEAGKEPPVADIVCCRVLFRVWVANSPVVDGFWPVIGKVEVPDVLAVAPWFFKQDPISGVITVGRTGSEERLPEPGEVENLERAAVWSASHVVGRLQDYFSGRPNKWVASMRPKK